MVLGHTLISALEVIDVVNPRQSGACFIPGPQYQGIADTIVQLIRRSNSGVIAPSRPIRLESRHFNKRNWPHR